MVTASLMCRMLRSARAVCFSGSAPTARARRATTFAVAGLSVTAVVGCGSTTRRVQPSSRRGTSTATATTTTHSATSNQAVLNNNGMFSTPGAFPLPQLGLITFRCSESLGVQPIFDMRGAEATEEVTVRAAGITRRNFRTRVVGQHHGVKLRETSYSPQPQLALPFGHYRNVVFTVRQGTEAREITAKVEAEFVAGAVHQKGAPRGWACYATRWLANMRVSPY
jgi:hypothetical protein